MEGSCRESERKMRAMQSLSVKFSGNAKFAICLVALLSILSVLAVAESTVIDWRCNGTQSTSSNANFQGNLKSLLRILVKRSRDQFAAITHRDGVFGLFQCFGDVSAYDCNICYREAKYFVEQRCPEAVGATVWSNWCFLRYEAYDFVSKLEAYDNSTKPPCAGRHVSGKKSMAIPLKLMADLSAEAPETERLFAAKSVGDVFRKMRVEIQGNAQCWKDLSRDDCRKCLSRGLQEIDKYCDYKIEWRARFLSENCILMYTIMFAPASPRSASSSPAAGTIFSVNHPSGQGFKSPDVL